MRPLLFVPAVLLAMFTGASADDAPERIVSAGGDLTEIVYALGAADRLVGVDTTSVYPGEAQQKPQIGYVRRIAAEGLLSLKPDLVLAAYDAGPEEVIAQIRATGVEVAVAPEADSIEGVLEKIRFVGEALHQQDAANTLAEKVEKDIAIALSDAQENSSGKRVLFLLAAGEGAPLVAGDNSSAGRIIELAGGTNAATGFEGFKPMSREAILQARPDVLLMMSNSAERLGGIEAVLARPELALTPAGQNKRAVLMDGMLLLGFGPRTPQAIRELSQELSAQ